MSKRNIIHVITPGDHFSPSTGSAIPTIVHNISVEAAKQGFESTTVIDESTRKERYKSARVIECRYKTFKLNKYQKILDIAMGRIFGVRRCVAKMYMPAITSVSHLEASNVIIHNAVPHLSSLRRIAPQHRYFSWLNNDVLRLYSLRERSHVIADYDGTICCSHYIRDVTTAGLSNELKERVSVVQNGVDMNSFDIKSRQSRSTVSVLYIGRVVPEKGVHVLIDAVLNLNNKGFDFNVRIVGRCGFDNNDSLSDYEQKLRAMSSNCPNVQFLPFARREDVPTIMAESDILVVPSIWPDPNPLVVKEGLAAGLIVMGSDIGGIPEIMPDKSWLFRAGSYNDLSSLLEKVLTADDIVRNIGLSNRAHVRSYSWETQLGYLLDILNRN